MYENEKNYRLAVSMLVLVGLYAIASILLRGCGNLPNNGSGATEIGKQLEQARDDQSRAVETIKAASGGADSISKGIISSRNQIEIATGTVGRIEESTRNSGEIIRECQSILQAVRSRGKTENQ